MTAENYSGEESSSEVVEIRRAPLPAKVEELPWKSLRQNTINDQVQEVFRLLYTESQDFRNLMAAVGNEDAVTGNTVLDDGDAAGMIIDRAPDGSQLKDLKKWAIVKALRVVMNRAGINRKERAKLLDGEIVASPEENNNTDNHE